MITDKGECSDIYYNSTDDSYKGHFTLENYLHTYRFRIYGIEIIGEGRSMVRFDLWVDSSSVISDKLLKLRVEMTAKGMPVYYNDDSKDVVRKTFTLSDLESDIMHLFVMKILPKILTSGSSK